MALLPIFKDDNQNLMLMQTKWSSQLNRLLVNVGLASFIIENVQLEIGSNTINHRLGKILKGWRIVRLRGQASIYDDQDNNFQPQLTLILVSDAAVSCDIEVF